MATYNFIQDIFVSGEYSDSPKIIYSNAPKINENEWNLQAALFVQLKCYVYWGGGGGVHLNVAKDLKDERQSSFMPLCKVAPKTNQTKRKTKCLHEI